MPAKKKEVSSYKYFWLIVLISIVLVSGLWSYNFNYGYGLDSDERGIFGDMFGAVNAVFSGLAFAGIIISLYLQRIDLKNQFEEIQQTNKEFKIQNDTLQVQKFENQYYKMIDLHRDNVNEFSIPFFDLLDGTNSSRDNSRLEITHPNLVLRDVTGKKGFIDMFKELVFCLETANKILSKEGRNYMDSDINEFAYKIFFWGVYSDFAVSDKIEESHQHEVIKYLKKKQKEYKTNIPNGKEQTINTRYVPFQGHESRLAHYYRHLFQTVKYVVEQEKNKIIKYDDTRQYLRVLRAQLSNAEQLMLYYNYICGFGKNWDYLGDKDYEFLTKYRMIHNMPVDRVKIVEKPRVHFKEYICNNCTEDDPLFEWGDS